MKRFSTKSKLHPLIPTLFLLGLWTVSSFLVDNSVILPSIPETFKSLLSIIKSEGFLLVVISTLFRALVAFILSFLLSILLALGAMKSSIFEALATPLVNFMSSVPVIAVILLALIWLKPPQVPVFVGLLIVLPIMYDTVVASIENVNSDILQMLQAFRVSDKTSLRYIYMPSILLGLSAISGSTLSTALKMVVAGEVLSQPAYSIGSLLQLQKMYLNTSGVFAWIMIILLLSRALRFLMDSLKRKLSNKKWM